MNPNPTESSGLARDNPQLNIRIPRDIRDAWKALCSLRGESMTAKIIGWIEAEVREATKK